MRRGSASAREMRANSRSVRGGMREEGIVGRYRPSERDFQQASSTYRDETAKMPLLVYFSERGDRIANAGRSGSGSVASDRYGAGGRPPSFIVAVIVASQTDGTAG